MGSEPPDWALKNVKGMKEQVGAILDDPMLLVEGMAQGISDTYESEGIWYCAGYAVGTYAGTKGIAEAGKAVKGKVKVKGKVGESGSKTIKNVEAPILPEGSSWERNVLNSFAGGKSNSVTYGGGTTLYRVGGKNGGFWSLDPPPATEYQWRVDTAIKQEFCNDASTLYKMTIPEGATLSGLEGKVGSQGMGLYGGAHQVYIDYKAVPSDWIEIIPMQWK